MNCDLTACLLGCLWSMPDELEDWGDGGWNMHNQVEGIFFCQTKNKKGKNLQALSKSHHPPQNGPHLDLGLGLGSVDQRQNNFDPLRHSRSFSSSSFSCRHLY
jgi:hypothetical protein